MPPGCERAETRREGSQPRVSDSRVGVSVSAAARLHQRRQRLQPGGVQDDRVHAHRAHAQRPRARLHLRRTQGGTRHAPQHPRGYPRGPHREAGEPRRSTPGPATRRLRAHRVHVRTRPTRGATGAASPRACLRTALDHVAGDNPADDRAVALRAATRLAARLKGEEAAEEALERAAGGALARIAAEMDEPSDPFFGETQRCAAEVLLATAHSMVAVGGSGGSPPRHCSRRRH